jgi:prevent-host-death family protein
MAPRLPRRPIVRLVLYEVVVDRDCGRYLLVEPRLCAGRLTRLSNVTMHGHVQCSVATAKAKLSELIRAAHDHQEVVITDRGRPIARLVPYEQEETLDDRFQAFRERGLLLPATGSTKDPWPEPTAVPGALARFLEERE